MTPEERAKAIANRISFEAGAHHTSWFCATAKEWIATAIREAIAAEREACAKVADACEAQNLEPVSQSKNEKYLSEMLVRECRYIATAIRSRSKEET